ncbi:MAG: hypothetical protein KA369_08405 [Spirochaetes bacterium]|nr:hypothetical protein [Spirochaetota bacterium]
MNNFTRLKDKNFEKGRRYIGASDVPTLALMNLRYGQTPLMLWQVKTGRAEAFKGNERTRAGKELEPIVLKWGLDKLKCFEDEAARTSFMTSVLRGRDFQNIRSFTEARHARGYIVAHADLLQVDEPFIMEAKTAGFFSAHRTGDINYGYDLDDLSANGIPSSVYVQVQTQMLCYDVHQCYVTAMIDTGTHRLYGPIPAHRATQEKILAICERFWWHVEKDQAPKPETWGDVVALNPALDAESKAVVGGEDEQRVKEMIDRAARLRAREKEIKNELDDIKNGIGILLGANKYLESSSGESLATAFDVNKNYVKDKVLLEKHPKWYKALKKEGIIYENKFRNMRY